MLRIDGADELRAAALLYKRAPREVQAAIRKEAKGWAPTLKAAAEARASDPVAKAVARSGEVTVTAKGLRATFGTGTWQGVALGELARPWEFGTSRPNAFHEYYDRRGGRAVKVNRRTQRQVPRRKDTGRFLYPAVADCTPDLVGRWVRAVATAYGGA